MQYRKIGLSFSLSIIYYHVKVLPIKPHFMKSVRPYYRKRFRNDRNGSFTEKGVP